LTIDKAIKKYGELKTDWVRFAKIILNAGLDEEQNKLLALIQNNRLISLRAGHAWGKDYLAAVSALCYIYTNYPAKIICTAPTHRQAVKVVMSEIAAISRKAKIPLPGIILDSMVRFPLVKNNKITNEVDTEHFILAFKAGDHAVESWTGFHSSNCFVIVTEASGVSDKVHEALEGLHTGDNSKRLLVFNANSRSGEAFKSTESKRYVSRKLNCLTVPNVTLKKTIIPGRVDYIWVKDQIDNHGTIIAREDILPEKHDFEFEGKCYRPDNYLRVKVLGEFPEEDEDQVIKSAWIDAAFKRWEDINADEEYIQNREFILGVDVAGEGQDKTIAVKRYDNYIKSIEEWECSDPDKIHMNIVGKIKNAIGDGVCNVDAIGEGAGVYSRGKEIKLKIRAVKGSRNAKKLTCHFGVNKFLNMRCFLLWAIRDALDPKTGFNLALPFNDNLKEELTKIKIESVTSTGLIMLTSTEKIKKATGRSPDNLSALSMTFYPKKRVSARYAVGSGER